MSTTIKLATKPPVGLPLMKSGQTVSYVTGDDASIKAGRLTDFYTLASNNPFGNTYRFTDQLGTQSFSTNRIVIDWSTYNGSTVLGYGYNLIGTANWATAVANCAALSLQGFTSGWRMANIKELINVWDNGGVFTNKFATPFSWASADVWSSSTCMNNTANAIYMPNSATIAVFTLAKVGNTRASVAVRDFTVTGTTLS
jgi:hypothetical protein